MGWTGQHMRKPRSTKEYRDYFEKEFSSVDIIKFTVRGSTAYMVCHAINKNTGYDNTFAVICLTRMDRDGHFMYKDMDETCGPCYYDFPVTWLKLLSPTDSEYANNWRATVLKLHNEKITKAKRPYHEWSKWDVVRIARKNFNSNPNKALKVMLDWNKHHSADRIQFRLRIGDKFFDHYYWTENENMPEEVANL